jgi:hypothetical protein
LRSLYGLTPCTVHTKPEKYKHIPNHTAKGNDNPVDGKLKGLVFHRVGLRLIEDIAVTLTTFYLTEEQIDRLTKHDAYQATYVTN